MSINIQSGENKNLYEFIRGKKQTELTTKSVANGFAVSVVLIVAIIITYTVGFKENTTQNAQILYDNGI